MTKWQTAAQPKRVDQAAVRYLFKYSKRTGLFTRRVSVSPKALKGMVAGEKHPRRYVAISIRNKKYYAHRLAWLYVTGEWPDQIDHINGVKSDNRWRNLRAADYRLNSENRFKPQSNNTLKTLGVSPSDGKGFRARIGVRGKEMHLGTFPTKKKAHAVYVKAKRALHEGCTL